MAKIQTPDLSNAKQLDKENRVYLKDTLAEIQQEYADHAAQWQQAIKKNAELLKKSRAQLKQLQQKQKQCQKQAEKKATKALTNRLSTLAKKIKIESKNLADIEKTCERQKEQLKALTELKKQQKALQTSINTFYREWNAPQATVPAPARTKAKAATKKPSKAAVKKLEKAPEQNVEVKTDDSQQELFSSELSQGDAAPAFELINDQGETVSLAQFAGKRVALYFYPKDSTPGCTQQAKDFTERLSELTSANTVVLGVSRDSVESHQRFKEKYDLNITLLADTEESVCQSYGVIKEKNRYGKMTRGIERSTFLINEQGKITQIWRNVKVADHVEAVIAEVQPQIEIEAIV